MNKHRYSEKPRVPSVGPGSPPSGFLAEKPMVNPGSATNSVVSHPPSEPQPCAPLRDIFLIVISLEKQLQLHPSRVGDDKHLSI